MSDIELVIKIPENRYRLLKTQAGTNLGKEKLDEFAEAALNGIPLDKIRERISLEKLGYPPSAGYYKAIVKVLRIIDKYRAESEDKE